MYILPVVDITLGELPLLRLEGKAICVLIDA